MQRTIPMVASQRFRDLGVFPLDPNDYVTLQEFVRPELVNFYLRIFSDHQFRTIMLVGSPTSLSMLWTAFQTNLGRSENDPIDELNEGFLVKQVFQVFTMKDPPRHVYQRGDLATKLLCLNYLPSIRATTAPRENVVGMILEFQQKVLQDWCYCQFDLTDIPNLLPTRH